MSTDQTEVKIACVDVECPQCGFGFQIPVSEALTPLIETEVNRRVRSAQQQFTDEIREEAERDSDERNRVVLAAKDKIISDMRVQIDELRRKVDSGSSIAAGEVQELQLEAMLHAAFPTDRIMPVEKGCRGGDILQEVVTASGRAVGKIIWESKNTKLWSPEWLTKVKRDMRSANAAISVIATATLPKGVELFERIDDVFVVHLRCVLPLAQILRQVLIDIATVRASNNTEDGIAERLLSYLSGVQFRNRVLAIVEASIALQGDLDADKRATARRWARNQQHIDAVAQGVAAMYGDLQGLSGTALPSVSVLLPEGEPSSSMRKAS